MKSGVQPVEVRGGERILPLTGRQAHALLGLLLVFFTAWNLRTVFQDQLIPVTDTTVEDAAALTRMIAEVGFGPGIEAWLGTARKGPLMGPVMLGFEALVGDPLVAGRLPSVLLHVVLLVVVHALAWRMTRRRLAALLAVVLCGAYPGIYGWFRAEFHDAPLAVAVLLSAGFMAGPFTRRVEAVGLGVSVGLGLLAKMAFPVFAAAPGLVFLARRIAQRETRANVLLAGLIAAGLSGWFFLTSWDAVVGYFGASSTETPLLDRLQVYAFRIPGAWALLLGALASAGIALWRRVAEPWPLLILTATVVGGVALLSALFYPWARYMLPVLPVAALLVAFGLTALAEHLAERGLRRWARVGLALLLLGLMAWYVEYNLVGEGDANERGDRCGPVSPDRGDYGAYPRLVTYLTRRNLRVVNITNMPDLVGHRPHALDWVWERRGYRLPELSEEEIRARLREGGRLRVVLCHLPGDAVERLREVRRTERIGEEVLHELQRRRYRTLQTFEDRYRVKFSLLASD